MCRVPRRSLLRGQPLCAVSAYAGPDLVVPLRHRPPVPCQEWLTRAPFTPNRPPAARTRGAGSAPAVPPRHRVQRPPPCALLSPRVAASLKKQDTAPAPAWRRAHAHGHPAARLGEALPPHPERYGRARCGAGARGRQVGGVGLRRARQARGGRGARRARRGRRRRGRRGQRAPRGAGAQLPTARARARSESGMCTAAHLTCLKQRPARGTAAACSCWIITSVTAVY